MYVYEILEATHGILLSGHSNENIKGFTQDSRKVKKGDMYIPLIGERFDGHDFIDNAFENGAQAIITSRPVAYHDKIVIQVDDTLQALKDMATYLRCHRPVKVISVTGSVGKTSTRDMIYSVVKQKYKTLKTEGNYNNEIGLPLTILRYQDEDVMVLEMGMNHLGEISRLSHIALPDIGAITNVGTAHIGELGSRENILQAKMEIVDGMCDGQPLIINQDNDMLSQVTLPRLNIVRVGQSELSDIRAKNIILNENNSEFDIVYKGTVNHAFVPVQGEHNISNALIAAAVGLQLDIDMVDIIKGIAEFELTKNRMDLIEKDRDIILIDGTYNASVDSIKSSLDVLANYKRRRIAVLGDMLELGEYSEALHREVGQYVAYKKIDMLICVGQESQYTIDEAKQCHMKDVYYFHNNAEVIAFLKEKLEPHDIVLLKGSHGMKLKEVVNAL